MDHSRTVPLDALGAQVFESIVNVLSSEFGVPRKKITLGARIVPDLLEGGFGSTDPARFALMVEKRWKFTPDYHAWTKVETIQDVIDLVIRFSE